MVKWKGLTRKFSSNCSIVVCRDLTLVIMLDFWDLARRFQLPEPNTNFLLAIKQQLANSLQARHNLQE
ncbi:MAG: hypothetical protein LAO21_23190 [Acidobacteriia bacterium]|nr:hypothetical protein [Terriglobia bacterium]